MQTLSNTSRRAGAPRAILLLLLASTLLAGCARFPGDSDVQRFATATQSVAFIGREAYSNHEQIHRLLAELRAQTDYVARYATRWANIEPLPEEERAQWSLRLAMLRDIETYAAALADTGSSTAPVEAAAAGRSLADTILQFRQSQNPNTALVPALLEQSVRAAGSALLSSRMRRVIVRTDPSLQSAARLLAQDFETLSQAPLRKAAEVREAQRQILLEFNKDGRNSSIELYQAYLAMQRRERVAAQLSAIFQRLPDGLRKMADAHAVLLSSSDDNRALSDFVATANALVEIGSTYQSREG